MKKSLSFVFGFATVWLNCLTTCAADQRENVESLRRIPTPSLYAFDNCMDHPADKIIGWMNIIEARLESTVYDCQIKAELSTVSPRDNLSPVVSSWSLALRRAKHHEKNSERYITVRQNLFDNLAIATNQGVAQDNREHYDILRLNDKCLSSNVSAFNFHTSETRSETKWVSAKNALRMFLVFDPIRACTATVIDVENGRATEANTHNVHPITVKAVVDDGKYVHVLLKLAVFNSSETVQLLVTFQDEVPVQFLTWDDVDKQTGMPDYTICTRSSWRMTGSGENEQRLPYRIRGSVELPYYTGDMEIDIAWNLGENVDEQLFESNSLGMLAPAEDVIFGIPLRLNEMLEEDGTP